MQIVHVNFAFDSQTPDFVSAAPTEAPFNAATSQKDGESFWIVVAAVGTLRKRRASELPTPPDQRVFQQAALFQVREQSRYRFVRCLRMNCMRRHVGMLIPARVGRLVCIVNLNKANS